MRYELIGKRSKFSRKSA